MIQLHLHSLLPSLPCIHDLLWAIHSKVFPNIYASMETFFRWHSVLTSSPQQVSLGWQLLWTSMPSWVKVLNSVQMDRAHFVHGYNPEVKVCLVLKMAVQGPVYIQLASTSWMCEKDAGRGLECLPSLLFLCSYVIEFISSTNHIAATRVILLCVFTQVHLMTYALSKLCT